MALQTAFCVTAPEIKDCNVDNVIGKRLATDVPLNSGMIGPVQFVI